MADHVQLAVECIEKAQDDTAIAHLLAAWDTQRAESIARIIELLELCVHGFGGLIGNEIPAPRTLTTAPLLERGRHLRALFRLWPESPVAVDDEGTPLLDPVYIDVLRELPPDPRIGEVIASFSYRFPLRHIEDDRTEELELDVSDPTSAAFREMCGTHTDWRLGSTAHGYPSLTIKAAVLSEAHEEQLRSAERTLRRRLFDDDNDRIRSADLATYADWLTTRGDPRGTAMSGTVPDDVYKLAKLWFGPLRAIAYPHMDTGIARKIRFTADGDADLDWRALELGWRPGWSAVEELERPPASLLASVELSSLRTLRVYQKSLKAAIAAGAKLPEIELLDLIGPSDVPVVKSLLKGVHVKHLVLGDHLDKKAPIDPAVASVAELLQQPRLAKLSVKLMQHEWFWAQSARFYREWKKRKPRVETLRVLGSAGERWVFTGDVVRVEWWVEDPTEFYVDRVAEVVAAGARAITIRAKAPLKKGILARLNKVKASITVEAAPEIKFDDEE